MKTVLSLVKKTYRSLKEYGIKDTIQKIIYYNGRRRNTTTSDLLSNKIETGKKKECYNGDIKFSILTPLYNTSEKFLKEMIESVINQTYQNWELCLVDASDNYSNNIRKIVNSYVQKDSRVRYKVLDKNYGISKNTNAALDLVTGDFICLLDHDDLLTSNALYENFKILQNNSYGVVYSDECHLSVEGKYVNPFFKPDWSPDLLYAQNYVCHLLVVRKDLINMIGGFNENCDGSQDYDLILRLSQITSDVFHIPKILYIWRESQTSTAANPDSKPYAHEAGRIALNKHLKKMYGGSSYATDGRFLFTYDAHIRPTHNEMVSIIIPLKDKWEMTSECVDSIFEKTTYKNYEVILLNNKSCEPETFDFFNRIQKKYKNVRVFDADFDFNWSKLNNFGISKANGDVYIFLNNDTKVISPDWLDRLVADAVRDDIGVVGALLKYEDDTIQHAGVVVGMGGWADHIFKGMPTIHFCSPFVSPMLSRNVLAVTGACMAISKNAIEKLGGFDESFIICGSDVEICLRAYENGLINKYNANVELYHLESKSRSSFIPDNDFICSKNAYEKFLRTGDPYFNKNLDIMSVEPRICDNG